MLLYPCRIHIARDRIRGPMSRNTRFPVAVHILVALALRDETLSSGALAWSIDTNASLVRRILGALKEAGLVQSRTGPKGGVRLAREPRRIPLLRVLEAVEVAPSALSLHAPNPECPLGAIIEDPLTAVLQEAEDAARRVLAARTVDDVARQARKLIVRRAKGKRSSSRRRVARPGS